MSDVGRDPAFAASPSSPVGSRPFGLQSGVGAEAGQHEGARYSPNLRKWLRARERRGTSARVYRNAGDNFLYIGQLFDDGWFHGSRLNRVLCVGSKAESWAFSPAQLTLTEVEGFWERYGRIGRCAIDEAHDRHFVGDETRWQADGDHRRCQWCGQHEQRLRRWTEQVERVRWEPAIAMEARQGGNEVPSRSDDSAGPQDIAQDQAGSQ